ncbi:MAG TPA: toll/interleukin-1 receptor domain-containing protein [Candidatus Competibacter phosphatis]|nr:toll/interleukin-1 receptor domain-containing protein [Candidatus Competibacter phosphatis]HMR01826.1 toll/interleukin-1 receptor domain-containing protein [Candidatus Competibacter phosphatis]
MPAPNDDRHIRQPARGRPVYVSYAWDGESEAFVDEFEQRLPKNFSLIRDKSALRAGDWISRFMQEIGRADMVLVVLSEKYLHSAYCMRELLYLHHASQGEKAMFLQRIVPLIVGDLPCARARDRHPYVMHWEQEYVDLSAQLEQRNVTTVGEADRQELLLIQDFKQHVSDLLAWIADTLMPRGTDLRTRGIDAAIGLLRERAAMLGNSAVVAAIPPGPASGKPVPKRSAGKIHAPAAAAITESLDLVPALCDALASQPGVGGAKPVELAKWLCALDGDVRAAIRSVKSALIDAAKTLRREGGDISALGQRALDILGWMVITTVMEGYEREDAELAKAWFDGVKFEIPLGRNPCIEVLTARWRGGKAEFGPEKSRHAFGVDDITPNNLQELGFDDPAKPEIERHVEYVRRLAYQKLIGPAPPKLSWTQKQDLDARLDDEREEKNRRLRLVIDRNDPDCVFSSRAVIDAIHDRLPQLLLIFVHSGQDPEDGVFVVPPSKLASAIYGFLEEIEKLA